MCPFCPFKDCAVGEEEEVWFSPSVVPDLVFFTPFLLLLFSDTYLSACVSNVSVDLETVVGPLLSTSYLL